MLSQGYDLLDLWRGKMSLRRLRLLIRYLPEDAPLWRAQEQAEVDAKAELLAQRAAAYAS